VTVKFAGFSPAAKDTHALVASLTSVLGEVLLVSGSRTIHFFQRRARVSPIELSGVVIISVSRFGVGGYRLQSTPILLSQGAM